MSFEPRLEIIGAALADASRVRILCELMDGRSHTGKELASIAGVTPSTASEHLGKLRHARVIRAEKSGRCVYYRLASAEIAEVLERMSAFSPTAHLYRAKDGAMAPEMVARTCYNHIAGRLGVSIAHGLTARKWISTVEGSSRLTPEGRQALERIGVSPPMTGPPSVKCCLDWSERRRHFSGELGTLLLSHALSRQWVTRARQGRALRIEPEGFAAFEEHFGIQRADLLGHGQSV